MNNSSGGATFVLLRPAWKNWGTAKTVSGRGCRYTSDAYQKLLQCLDLNCSRSRTGCCCDNAVMERFFWSLKYEGTNHQKHANLQEVRLSVFRYIETLYNSQRLYQTLGYVSANQFEAQHAATIAAGHPPASLRKSWTNAVWRG